MNSLVSLDIIDQVSAICADISLLPEEERIACLNQVRRMLHEISPFRQEPVDCVLWIKNEAVQANDYNPNKVAPPEMKLLQLSIEEDGYTQPIVVFDETEQQIAYTIVDGFHRNRVGREYKPVRERLRGYLPVAVVNQDRTGRCDRMAATYRHNQARGKHQIEGMAEMIQELVRRGWSDAKISSELGMDDDEVLRLKQVSGLAALFADREFSEAWEAEVIEDDPVTFFQEVSRGE